MSQGIKTMSKTSPKIVLLHYLANKKAQLTLTNPRDSKGCKNCSDSTCFVSFHRIPFPQIANA